MLRNKKRFHFSVQKRIGNEMYITFARFDLAEAIAKRVEEKPDKPEQEAVEPP